MNSIIVQSQFAEIHSIIEFHRSRAFQSINRESLFISWEIGQYISAKLKNSEWGSNVVTQLSEYLKIKDPSLKGYSRRSLYKMVHFYKTYSDDRFLELISSLKLPDLLEIKDNSIVPTMSAQLQMPEFLTCITWSQHCEIMDSCNLLEANVFYILYSYNERLNVRELRRAIKTNAYMHVFAGIENQSAGLKQIYPTAGYLFKDIAYLDFLGLPEKHKEKRLQKDILSNMKNFILELGKDFLFMEQEYPLQVGDKTFKIDLLFYHRGLQCLVAVELKTTDFEPAFMGQLEFYLEALDQDVKRSNENPSIGILLCKEANRDIVKYALNRSMSPTMVAKYERELIPKEILQRSLSEFCFFIENRKISDIK